MLGRQELNTDLFQCVTMEALVPPNHLLRRIHRVMDLGFVRARVASLYSAIGRRSYDPEVVVRMWILQHLYGLSEREVCDEVTMHAGFRWFCGLSFNDDVPDQSTLVKLRTQKWAETGLWEELLAASVRWCEAAGVCRPEDRKGVDGTQISARAATVSLEAIPPSLSLVETGAPSEDAAPEEPEHQTPENPCAPPVLAVDEGGRSGGQHKSGDPDWHGERFSNATHRSTTDPEARLYRKSPGQEAKLRFLGHYLADLRSGVIYQAMATQAHGHAEREAAIAMVDRLPEKPDERVFDLGYRDGDFLAEVLARGVQPLVPIGSEPLEEVPHFKRATYNLQRARKRRARQAATQARNATRLATRGRRGALAQRQRTRLEHLIGEAKEHHGMDRAQGYSIARLDKQIKLTASVQNLKRLLGARKRCAAGVCALKESISCSLRPMGARLIGHRTNRKARRILQAGFGEPHRIVVFKPETPSQRRKTAFLHHASSTCSVRSAPLRRRARRA